MQVLPTICESSREIETITMAEEMMDTTEVPDKSTSIKPGPSKAVHEVPW